MTVPLSAQAAATGSGQAYPTKPVRLLVPFVPGGGTDTLARMIAQRLTESEPLGQSVVVDNRPSVDGIVGTETVAKRLRTAEQALRASRVDATR